MKKRMFTKSKLLAVLLCLTMMTVFPAAAFAQDTSGDAGGNAGNPNEESAAPESTEPLATLGEVEPLDATPDSEFSYSIISDEVHIGGYTGTSTDVIVPETIDGKPVTEIGFESKSLTSLDVTMCSALVRLDCMMNNLTTLDVSKNPELETLYCGINQLTALDVSKNTKLESLNCDANSLNVLDISKNTALRYLFCSGNKLTVLDVSNAPMLDFLICNNNRLTTLDLSKNTALNSTIFACKQNFITDADLLDYLIERFGVDNALPQNTLSFSGVVTDEDGNPVPDVELRLNIISESGSIWGMVEGASLGRTDASGAYSRILYDAPFEAGSTYSIRLIPGMNSPYTFHNITFDSNEFSDRAVIKNVTLEKGAVLTGTVTGISSPSDCVLVARPWDPLFNEPIRFGNSVNERRSSINGDGSYNLAGLGLLGREFTDEYLFCVSDTSSVANRIESTAYYYKEGTYGTDDVTQATRIKITGKEVIPNINVDLSKPPNTPINSGPSGGEQPSETILTSDDLAITFPSHGSNDYKQGENKDFVVHIDKDISLYDSVRGVYLDGVILSSAYYNVTAGSTVVTLSASYLDTLATGTHWLYVPYTDGTAVVQSFDVSARGGGNTSNNTSNNSNNAPAVTSGGSPGTGDDFSAALWLILAFVSVLIFCATGLFLRRRKQDAR